MWFSPLRDLKWTGTVMDTFWIRDIMSSPLLGRTSHYCSPKGWSNTTSSIGNSTLPMSGNQGYNSGIIGRHRNMSIGGRGSPTPSMFGHFGDNNVNKYIGSMFNEGGSNCTGGNMPSAPLRSMEQMRNYNCNPSPFLNGSPFDLGSQVKKKYSFHFIVFQLSANKSVLNSPFTPNLME